MKKITRHILLISLPVLMYSVVFSAKSGSAESFIRIISDKPAPSNSSAEATPESSRPSAGGGTAIRITGEKTSLPQLPTSVLPPLQEQNQSASPFRGIRIIGDKKVIIPELTDEEKRANKEAERLMAQQLLELKAEEERKEAEIAEQLRQAQLKAEQEAEQEAEAVRQATIKQEQELLAVRLAEEARKLAEKMEQEKIAAEVALQAAIKKDREQQAALRLEEERKAAEKLEQERVASLKAVEERLAAARKVLLEKSGAESRTNDVADSLNQVIKADGTPDQSIPATIWGLYVSAKANDPALGRSEARVSGSKAESDMVMSALLPHVDSSAGVKQISQSFVNYTPTDTSYDYTSINYSVTARMTLLNVPTIYSLFAAEASLKAEQAGVAAVRQSLIVKFTDAYFSLLKSQTDRQIAAGEINRLKQVLNQSEAFLKAGTGDIIAVYEAQSRLDGAKADLTRSESSLRLAEQKLSTVVGKPVTLIENYLPQQPTGPSPDDLDWWVATMEKEQPLLRQAREGLAQTSEQRKSVKSEYLPILQASGGYDVNRGTSLLPTAETRQWFVGASMSLPLYSGGETAAKVRRAVASEEERRHVFDETMDQMRENLKQAFFNLRYNVSFIRALEQRKASAEIQLAAVSKGRTIGTRNAIDLLNAEQAYSLALRDYKFALYDNIIRVIQLKSAAGILSEEDVSGITKSIAPTLISRLKN